MMGDGFLYTVNMPGDFAHERARQANVGDVSESRQVIGVRALIGMDSDTLSDFAIDVQEFDGPPASNVGGVPYATITSFGEKLEGQSAYPDDETRCWTEAEALWRLKRQFRAYLLRDEHRRAGYRQLAWRQRPYTQQGPEGDFIARCRFALLSPENVVQAEVPA